MEYIGIQGNSQVTREHRIQRNTEYKGTQSTKEHKVQGNTEYYRSNGQCTGYKGLQRGHRLRNY